jgi:3-phosphoshikimate 1-carboxyvinyltransferase
VSKKTITAAKTISGVVELPGDKSISHRYAMLASLARGRSEIENYSPAADCASTLECVSKLGAKVERLKGNGRPRVAVTGAGLDGWKRPRKTLDAENSGTTLRLLTGLLAGQKFDSSITGDASLRRRPMRRVIEPLSLMGARIEARESNFAPLEIHGLPLHYVKYTLPVASAQVKSAILLAGLLAEGESSVEERVRTRDHTELALAEFGATVRHEGSTVSVTGRPSLAARKLSVPGDLSSAVFFMAAAMVLPGSKLLLHNVGLNPTRAAVLDVFSEWGARLQITSVRSEAGELVGDVTAEHAPLSGGVLSGARIAQLIDELPMLAALGPYTEQGVEIRDATELRVKESDRIAVMAENLRRMGATVEERPDGLRVEGRSAGALHGAEIDPHGDHRIAMAFAVAALGARGETRIRDAECVAVSYPDFFSVLERLVTR